MKTLYLFVDESGNFDFTANGTKYFVLTLLSTTEPSRIGRSLMHLRYELLPNYGCGERIEEHGYFHASEDQQNVRDKVFTALLQEKDHVRIDAVIAQKNKANPVFHDDETKLYKTTGEAALKYTFARAGEKHEHIVMVFSSLFDRKKRAAINQSFKAVLKQYSTSHALYFHDCKLDFCNQAVDYFGWAIYRKWESNDKRSFDLISSTVKTEFDIFAKGTEHYYEYKK